MVGSSAASPSFRQKQQTVTRPYDDELRVPTAKSNGDEYGDVMLVESQDIPESNSSEQGGSFFRELLHRMSPSQCLNPAGTAIHERAFKPCMSPVDDGTTTVQLDDEYEVQKREMLLELKTLLEEIRSSKKQRTPALQRMYLLTDRDHIQNRYVVTICCV